MSKNWIKHINKGNILSKSLLLLTFFIFSCEDQGCIDADDFGEYESETIEILANGSALSCTYDASEELSSASQGLGLIACFSQGTITLTDYDGVDQTSDSDVGGGCEGFEDISVQNICIQQCVQQCLLKSSSETALSQPNWTSTNERSSTINSGVTIRNNSEILITAAGTINFGDTLSLDPVYVRPNVLTPHSKSTSATAFNDDSFFNIKNGQIVTLTFSGEWNNGQSDFGGTSGITANPTTPSQIAQNLAIHNGTRRIAAYAISYPDGHSFDSSATSELSGSQGIPLLPDPNTWECIYNAGGTETEATCQHKADSYTGIGYSDVVNSLAEEAFPISSSFKT